MAARLAVRKGLLQNLSDAESIANLAIVTALREFRSDAGASFKTFFLLIFLRAARNTTDGRTVPRSVADQLRRIEAVHDLFMWITGTKPTIEQLAKGSELTVARVNLLLVKWKPMVHPEQLDAAPTGDHGPKRSREPRVQPVDFERRQQLELVLEAAERLRPALRAMVECMLAGMTFGEIADALGISSEVAARQRWFNAVPKIRERLARAIAAPGGVTSPPTASPPGQRKLTLVASSKTANASHPDAAPDR